MAKLRAAFGLHSLKNASWKVAKGQYIGPEDVAAIQAANPHWATDPHFSRYVETTDGGHKRLRGRPRMGTYRPREKVAEAYYDFAYRLIRRERAAGRLESLLQDSAVVKMVGQIDPTLPLHLLSAEIVQRRFRLPISASRFYQRVRERAK